MVSSPKKNVVIPFTEDELNELIGEAIKHLNLNENQKIMAVTGYILENTNEVRDVYQLERTGLTRNELKDKLNAVKEHAESLNALLENLEIKRAIEYCADIPSTTHEMLTYLISIVEKTQNKFQDPDGDGKSEPEAGRGRAIAQIELSAKAQLVVYADALYCLCHNLERPPGEGNSEYLQFLDCLWAIVVNVNATEGALDWRRQIRTARIRKNVTGSLTAHLIARVGADLSIGKIRYVIHPKNTQ